MIHFITNWQRKDVFKDNDEQLIVLVQDCEALDQEAKDAFLKLYVSAKEQYFQGVGD